MNNQDTFRNVQLFILGIIAAVIAPLVVLLSMAQCYPFPQSISETATMDYIVGNILPVSLGALGIFSFSYAYTVKFFFKDYFWDRLFTVLMGVGFLAVALFPTSSPYLLADNAVIAPAIASVIHGVGAIIGFGTMVAWILLCFTKSNVPKERQSKSKRLRNRIFRIMGTGINCALILLILSMFGVLPDWFQIVFWVEFVILECSGAACIIKSRVLI